MCMKLTENLKNACTYMYTCVSMCTCVKICICTMCRFMYKCIWIWTVYSFMCMCVRHAWKFDRCHAYIYRSICLHNWDGGSLCLSFQTGLPQAQTDETTVLQYHSHPFVWFRATEFLRFSHTGIEYQHI